MLYHTGTVPLGTERLILRAFTEEDIPYAYRNWAGDEEVQNGYGEPVYETAEKTAELIRKYIENTQKSDYYRWAVILRESGECVGQAAFFLVSTDNALCEIEYCIGRRWQNKGYISEAVREILRFAFEDAGFNRVQISCRSNNLPSKKVIEKCGFIYEGSLRKYFKYRGEFCDRLYYGILADEYKAEASKLPEKA